MAQERSVIKFIRPCLSIHEDKKILTSEYCWQRLNKKRAVQINLDNCSLQRMEELSTNSTLEDVRRVGLLPCADQAFRIKCSHFHSPGTSLAGSCKHTLYIPLWNRSPCHRLHRTFSRENAARTSHNATPARQVMAIKTSPYHQCKDGIFPDSAPHRPPSVARSGHVNHAQTTPPEHLSAKSTDHDRKGRNNA